MNKVTGIITIPKEENHIIVTFSQYVPADSVLEVMKKVFDALDEEVRQVVSNRYAKFSKRVPEGDNNCLLYTSPSPRD